MQWDLADRPTKAATIKDLIQDQKLGAYLACFVIYTILEYATLYTSRKEHRKGRREIQSGRDLREGGREITVQILTSSPVSPASRHSNPLLQ